ncbi:MAG: hypothetical protein N3F06_04565 [Nitrososphaerales archaeon]|nr:hypothetical protein [Nitrososphaerales archaeon]
MSKFTSKISKVYYGSLSKGGEEGLKFLKAGNQPGYEQVRMLVDAGAELLATEDPVLVEETMSWLRMVEDEPKGPIQQMIKKNMSERNRYVARRINETLLDGEVGVIFLEPYRNLKLSPDIRVIRVCPFSPEDYVKLWQTKLKSAKE